jgi:isoquinoline 1-oxidoreductase beta subunit
MNGRLQQTNYDRYPVLRLNNSPPIEIGILESPGAPVGGIGEAGVPLIAPALANAIHAATGRRLRSLPLRPANPA